MSRPRSAINRAGGRIQSELIKLKVQPVAELKSRLTDGAGVLETERLVQTDAGRVL